MTDTVDTAEPPEPAGTGRAGPEPAPEDASAAPHAGAGPGRAFRRRKPWGLGDVAIGMAVSIGSNIVLGVAIIVWAVLRDFPAFQADPDSAFQAVEDTALASPFLLANLLGLWAGFVLVPLRASRRKGAGTLREDFGWSFDWRRDAALGAGLALGLRVFETAMTAALDALGADLSGAGNTGLVTDRPGAWLAVFALAAVFGAPLAEELFFRGLFLRAVLRRFRRPRLRLVLAALVPALTFGALHIQALDTGSAFIVGQATVIGVVFAAVTLRSGRLGPAVLGHVLFNASGVVLALALGV